MLYGIPQKVQYLAQNETVDVNGHQMTGEATIWRQWTLRECGPCIFARDQNTETSLFSFARGDETLSVEVIVDEDERLASEIFALSGDPKATGLLQPELNISDEDTQLADSVFRRTQGLPSEIAALGAGKHEPYHPSNDYHERARALAKDKNLSFAEALEVLDSALADQVFQM